MTSRLSRLATILDRHQWTLRRFALTPARAPLRIVNTGEPRILCNSVPKSGTHLLERALCLHPRLYRPLLPTITEVNVSRHGGLHHILTRLHPGGIVVAHLAARPDWVAAARQSGVRSLLMIRDPRDIVVSTAHYIATNPSHPWHRRYLAVPDLKARLALTITGDGVVVAIAALLRGFMDWASCGALVVRFEDLVGASGGGTDERQWATLRSIYSHIGLPLGDRQLERISRRLFSSRSPTFRSGTIGQWRRAFDAEISTLFAREAGELLPTFGYAQ